VGAYWKIDWPKLGHSASRIFRRIRVSNTLAFAHGASGFACLEEFFEVFDHFASVSRARVVKAEDDSADLQLAVHASRDQIDRFQQLGKP